MDLELFLYAVILCMRVLNVEQIGTLLLTIDNFSAYRIKVYPNHCKLVIILTANARNFLLLYFGTILYHRQGKTTYKSILYT